MMSVWKFEFEIKDGPQAVVMPMGAHLLSVGMQRDTLCLWAFVDTAAVTEKRFFVVHGTGHPIKLGETYVGTAMHGALVWHLFMSLGLKEAKNG